MKRIFTFLLLTVFALNSHAAVKASWATDFSGQPEIEALSPEMMEMAMDDFLALTPKKYKEMTGEKLTFGQSLKLKAAQKFIKKQQKKGAADFSKGLYILLAFLGLAWLAMGVMDDWEGSDWIVNLVLTYVCLWLPGFIHALVKMKKYY